MPVRFVKRMLLCSQSHYTKAQLAASALSLGASDTVASLLQRVASQFTTWMPGSDKRPLLISNCNTQDTYPNRAL
jgi:hypothetical protein